MTLLFHTINILVCLAAITKSHRPSGSNDKNVFFTVLETTKSRIRICASLVSGDESDTGLWTDVFLLCLHSEETEQALVSLCLLVRAPALLD